jgi:two-component system nitrate/nitrite response regulator NarL
MIEPLRVLLVDDHGLCRLGLAELIELRLGFRVVATTGNPEEAVGLIESHKPDLAVIDLRMAPLDGLRLLRRLRDSGSKVPVVILTMSDSRDDLAAALRMGARGYLLKDMDPNDVIEAISRAARGELVVAPAMTAKLAGLLEEGKQRQERESSLDLLTARERQILAYVSRGLSNKAIAKTLGISHDTVKLHVRHILSKLGFSSRVEAAVFAIEHRIEEAARTEAAGQRDASLPVAQTDSR